MAAPAPATQILINEFMASNDRTIADEDGDHADWIELYNPTDRAITLQDHFLTDDPGAPRKWSLPSRTVQPHGYLLIWASDKDRRGGELHTNFKLASGGEFVGLYTSSGPIDTVEFGPQQRDVAMARIPDGADHWRLTRRPTPRATNRWEPAQDSDIVFSLAAGQVATGSTLTLTSSLAGAEIHYTLDGTEPTRHSQTYVAPLTLDASVCVRAQLYEGATRRSHVVSRLYIVGAQHQLPVVSIITDPDHLWDDQNGIMVHYQERGRDWERPIQLSLIENGVTRFDVPAGVRIHGNITREWDKKSLRLEFRSSYGVDELPYVLFDQKPDLDEFEALVLHSGGNDQPSSHLDWTLLRDSLASSLYMDTGGVAAAHRPVILYLNEQYWGIYWLRERIDDEYVESNFDVGDDIDLVEGGFRQVAKEGSLSYWNQTFSFFEDADFTQASDYERALNEFIVLDNFVRYFAHGIFVVNVDWPHNNQLRFRPRSGRAPWRWLPWDYDSALHVHDDFGPEHNTVAFTTRAELRHDLSHDGLDKSWRLWGTVMLRKLLHNDDFKERFVTDFADDLNTVLAPQHVRARIDALAGALAADIPDELNRWRPGESPNAWHAHVDRLRAFAAQRAAHVLDDLDAELQLGGDVQVTIHPLPPSEARIWINGVDLSQVESVWSGTYFQGVPLELRAEPGPDEHFLGWGNATVPNQAHLHLELTGDVELRPSFTSPNEAPSAADDLVSGAEDTQIQIDVLGNDSDPDGDPLDVTVHEAPEHGAVSVAADARVLYLPDLNFHGEDYFAYRVSDPAGLTATATVHVTVLAVNDAPVAVADSASTGANAPVWIDVLANDTDVEGDPLTIARIVQPPTGGTAWMDGAGLVFSPAEQASGQLTFAYVAQDPAGGEDTATVTVEVSATNDAPQLVALAPLTIDEDSTHRVALDDWVDDPDDPDSAIQWTAQLWDGSAATDTVRVTINAGTRQATFGGAPNFFTRGATQVILTARDPAGNEATGALALAIAPVNDPPERALPRRPLGTPVQPGPVEFHWQAAADVDGDLVAYILRFFSAQGDTAVATDATSQTLDLQPFATIEQTVARWRVDTTDGLLLRPGTTVELELGRLPSTEQPIRFALHPNYPNPFNPATTIAYDLPVAADVALVIYGGAGRVVRVLHQDYAAPGEYRVEWDGTDAEGALLPSGIYFVRITAEGFSESRKIVLSR